MRDNSDVIQVVITHTASGKSYRPYVGDDPDRAKRIATSWGNNPHYTAVVKPLHEHQ